MIEEIPERESRLVAGGLQPGMQLLPERRVQRAVDEIVGLLDADMTTGLREVTLRGARAAGRFDGLGPYGHFQVQQLRRPPAPGERAPADGEDQPAVVERRMIGPRHAQIRSATEERHVLHVLGQNEWTGFEDENPPGARRVGDEQMFGDHRAERPAPDDNHVEVPLVPGHRLGSAVERLLQRVAEEAPHVVQREGCGLRGEW